MRLLFLAAAVATVCGARPAAAQRTRTALSTVNKPQDRLALATRPRAAAAGPMRLACVPLVGQVFNPNGQALVGATLLIKGTHQVYVTDASGRFLLSDPVYEGQVLAVEAAGYALREVPLIDCTLPRLVLARAPDARIKRKGKRAGQVTRLHHRNTNLR